jgi:hypothetical protein
MPHVKPSSVQSAPTSAVVRLVRPFGDLTKRHRLDVDTFERQT